MRFNELIQQQTKHKFLDVIQNACQQFISESRGYPLLKGLPLDPLCFGSPFREVKVRHRSKSDVFTESFNQAFVEQHNIPNLYQRAIFANGSDSYVEQPNNITAYVFPLDGYKFLYNEAVTSSSYEYRHAFQQLVEQTNDEDTTRELLTELMSYTYISTDLHEGIQSGAEILIFGIQRFYAVYQDSYPDYHKLYNTLGRT